MFIKSSITTPFHPSDIHSLIQCPPQITPFGIPSPNLASDPNRIHNPDHQSPCPKDVYVIFEPPIQPPFDHQAPHIPHLCPHGIQLNMITPPPLYAPPPSTQDWCWDFEKYEWTKCMSRTYWQIGCTASGHHSVFEVSIEPKFQVCT